MNRRGVVAKLAVFLAVGLVFAVMEVNTLTGPHVGATDRYCAVFGGSDGVSGLRPGNAVRAAGVDVGKVLATDLVDAEHVRVTFTVNRRQRLTSHTWAVVRYANLLGQRFLALTQSGGPGTPLPPGATIPQSRTAPALSLTALFNGFRPIFSALTPEQVNDLSGEIVQVLQGQGGTIQDLVSRTASLTTNLADRDRTFRQVIDSLSTLLTAVARHDDQLAAVVTTLGSLTSRLRDDGPGILASLDSVDALAGSVAGLFGRLEDHNLPRDIAALNSVTRVLARDSGTVRSLVGGFADAFETFSRISQNGNWVNLYVCRADLATYGTPTVTAKDGVDALAGLPGLGSLLSALGTGPQGLAALALPLPLKIPNGPIGSGTAQTAVCR